MYGTIHIHGNKISPHIYGYRYMYLNLNQKLNISQIHKRTSSISNDSSGLLHEFMLISSENRLKHFHQKDLSLVFLSCVCFVHEKVHLFEVISTILKSSDVTAHSFYLSQFSLSVHATSKIYPDL